MPVYTDAIPRDNWEKHGEHPSVLDFGAVGDGVTDDLHSFQIAINEIIARNGRSLYIPGGRTYLLSNSLTIANPPGPPAVPVSLTIYGDGRSTILKRSSTVTASQGLIDITLSSTPTLSTPTTPLSLTLQDFLIDGATTTPAPLNYSSFAGNPLHALLTSNTSIWIHSGHHITLSNLTFLHTGGYACLANATAMGAGSNDITHLSFLDCSIENCRPHLFGTDNADLNYGSWTGGILLHGNGTNSACKHVLVSNLHATRCTGNVFWQHLYAFSYLHEDITVINSTGTDIGRDFIQFGGVIGGSCSNNYARRIGYIALDDTSPSTPKFLPSAWAVGIDCSGVVSGVSITDNTLISCNGGYMDLDGFTRGIVSNNICRTPSPSDPEYTPDQIATVNWGARTTPTGPSWEYGAQTSNSSNYLGGLSVIISRNKFINLGGGGVNGYALRSGEISHNVIESPAQPSRPPITLGTIGTGPFQRSYDNSVSNNLVYYSPTTNAPAIFEDPTNGAFSSTDKNWVASNRIITTTYCYEFLKDTNTTTTTRLTLHTSARVPTQNESWLQREGSSIGSTYTRIYSSVSYAQTSLLTLYDNATIHGTASPSTGPLLSITSGTGTGGVLSTGGRTTSAVDDSVITGKLYSDSFLALAPTTYSSTEADLFPSTTALLRYDGTAFYYSTSVSSGSRVWSLLFGATAAGGADTQVQYNSGGALAGSPSFIYNNTTKLVTITGITATAALSALTGFIQSTGGFLSLSTDLTSIQSPVGGLSGKYLIGTTSLTLVADTEASAGLSSPGQIRIICDSDHANKAYISESGGSFVPLVGSGSGGAPGSPAGAVQYNNGAGGFAGSSNLLYNDTAKLVTITGTASTAALSVVNGYIQTGGGLISQIASYQAVQAQATGGGALFAGYGLAEFSGKGGYFDFAPLSYANYPLPLTGLSAFGTNDILLWSSGANSTVTANATYGLNTNGFINAAAGFATASTATNSIQSVGGGLSGKYLIGTTSLTLVADTQAHAGISSTGQCRIICDSGNSNKAYISENGAAFVPLLSGGASAGPTHSVQRSDGSGGFTGTTALTCDGGSVVHNGIGGYIQLAASVATGFCYIASSATTGGSFNVFRIWAVATGSTLELMGNGGITFVTFPAGTSAVTCATVNAAGRWGFNSAPSATAGVILTVGGTSGVAGLTVTGGHMQSDQGFYSPGTSYQTVNLPSGGSYARSHHSIFYTDIGNSSGIPTVTTGATMRAGCMYYDTSTGLKVHNGSAWVSYAPSVTSVTGFGNISVSPTSGAVVVSMLTSPSFTTATASTGFKSGTYAISDSSGRFIGNGVAVYAGIGGTGFNFFYTNSFAGGTYTYYYRGGGTDTINVGGTIYGFEGGVLTTKNSVAYNSSSLNVTPF